MSLIKRVWHWIKRVRWCTWKILKKQLLLVPFILLISYFIGMPPVVIAVDKAQQKINPLSPDSNSVPSENKTIKPDIKTPDDVKSNAEEINKVTSELTKTILTAAISMYVSMMIAIITLYQNIYKGIDDKINGIKKDDIKKEVELQINNATNSFSEKQKIEFKERKADLDKEIEKIIKEQKEKSDDLIKNSENFESSIKLELKEKLDDLTKKSDAFDNLVKESETKFNAILVAINKTNKDYELRIKISEFIGDINNEYAAFLDKLNYSANAITTDLLIMEKCLLYIASDDGEKILTNLYNLKSLLLTPNNPHEQQILDYLRLLYENGKFDAHSEAREYLINNIVKDHFNGSFR